LKKGLITFVLTSTLIYLTGCAGDNQNAGSDNNGGNLGVNNVRNNIRNTTGPNLNTGTGAITGNNTGAGTDRITGTNSNTGNNGTGGTGTNTGNTGTNMNGNNGTGGTNYKEVSNRLEQRIADQVRASDKNIHNVYVSYDNDFYSQMNNYTNDIQNGRNRNGIWDDFTDTVGRFFD
jgi:hypothetical protein